MTNFQAFCRGFASAWDFTRPFSEKARFRSQLDDFDDQWVQYHNKDAGIWEAVGNYLYEAIDNYQRGFSGNVPKQ